MNYIILSNRITVGSVLGVSCQKAMDLYPPVPVIDEYKRSEDLEYFKNLYFDFLGAKEFAKPKPDFINATARSLYDYFIDSLERYRNVCIVCDENENYITDALCEFLKKIFEIEVIDLNELFTKGRVGPIRIDRAEVHDKAVDIRTAVKRELILNRTATTDGKIAELAKMDAKGKRKLLKHFGIDMSVKEIEKRGAEVDQAILEEWIAEEKESSGQ